MKSDCTRWKDELLETALSGKTSPALERHLSSCAGCAEEMTRLKARRAKLDELLPGTMRGAGPSVGFSDRVMAAIEATGEWRHNQALRWWPLGVLVPVAAALMIVFAVDRNLRSTVPGLKDAQRLASWRAPTDALLESPGQKMLQKTPALGESYINIPVKNGQGEMK